MNHTRMPRSAKKKNTLVTQISCPGPYVACAYAQYKICVSGSAATRLLEKETIEKAKDIGRNIVLGGGVVVTGATSGIPYYAAMGAKELGGICIGFSPAASERAHLKVYQLPIDFHDLIVYTGFEYAGRNLILTRSSDGVIIVGGRIGTLNEFTIAFEDKKPIGVLTGTGGNADMIQDLVKKSKRGPGKIVYDSDPKKLVQKLIKLIEKDKL